MENTGIFVACLGLSMAIGGALGLPDALWLIRSGFRRGWLGPAAVASGILFVVLGLSLVFMAADV